VGEEIAQNEEWIFYVEIGLDKCVEGKQYHDVVRGYQTLDLFDLRVDRMQRKPTTNFKGSKTGNNGSRKG
jgi:hypothetical protein